MSPVELKEIEGLAASLRLAVGRLARRLRQHSLDSLTPSQLSVLATLERDGPLRMGELARIENITPPSITGIVARLEEKKMVARSSDPDDARSTVVAITRSGSGSLDAVRRERTAFLATQLQTLRSDERDLLRSAVEVLDKLSSE